MRDWQYSWGETASGVEWHHMDFFTDHGWQSWTIGVRPDIHAGQDKYDDVNMPRAWEPVSAVAGVITWHD